MNSRDLKILSLIPYQVLPAKLGGEKGIAVFNEYLCKLVNLKAVSIKSNDPSLAKGYTLLNTLSNSRVRYFNIFLFWKFKKIIQEEKITHFLIEHPYFGWLAWMLTKNLPVKWIVHSHNIEYMRSMSIGRWWWKGLKWYEGWVYRNADDVFFISEDDRCHAFTSWKINQSKTLAVPYGIDQPAPPTDKIESKKIVCAKHFIDENNKIFLFNGALYHSTNFDALSIILDKINPCLLEKNDLRYKIIVCGKGLPDSFNQLKGYKNKNIIYAGFVDDISIYFKAADVFLNPILSGGGIKTKAIEALAMNCTVVSTKLGAMGIPKELCGNKLVITPAGEWELFSAEIINACHSERQIPLSFFDFFYWGNILERTVSFLMKPNA
ncbi:MAG: glycosyltransferase [Flavitalea sp.]